MKKFLTAVIFTFGIFLLGTASAQSAPTYNDCEAWETFNDGRDKDDFAVIKNSEIRALIEAQINTKHWRVGSTDIYGISWKKMTQKEPDILKTKTWDSEDREFILAARACASAMGEDEDLKAAGRAFKKASLHIMNATKVLKRKETIARMPPIPHGNILPGAAEDENAADYVENKFIPKFVNGTLVLLISLSVLMLIISGLMYVVAGGDDELITRAKTMIFWSIFGTIITIMSYAIVSFIIGIDFSL